MWSSTYLTHVRAFSRVLKDMTAPSTWAIYGTTLLAALASGVVPVSPMEPLLAGFALLVPPASRPVIVILATLAQMASKAIVYFGSSKAGEAIPEKRRQQVERLRAKLEGRKWMQRGAVLLSSSTGVPPFYAVTLTWGALRLPLLDYLVMGSLGRATRFAAVVAIPSYFMN